MNHWTKALLAVAPLVTAGVFAGAPISSIRPAQAQDLNMDQIFRCTEHEEVDQEHCAEARQIILNNCTVCHTFAPIVMQQWTEGEWRGLLDRHVGGGRVDQLSAEQVDTIHAYLAANFNEELPPPELPPALLETWTSY